MNDRVSTIVSRAQVIPYRYGACFMVFDARQRHMTKAINLTGQTKCIKLGFFFGTKKSVADAEAEATRSPADDQRRKRAARARAREQQ